MSSSSNSVINPKSCVYGCNTRIYWNTQENSYFEVFTKKKHICPNWSNNNNGKSATTTNNNKPNYYNYNNKFVKQPKPKMSNSLELLTAPIEDIQKKYEILSEIVINEYNGKVHGSQRDRDPKTGLLDLLVYFEVPEGKREEVKHRFENYILTVNSSY